MNTPKLYTVKEAAKIVGVSTNTLYKYLDEDRIHAARGSAIQGRFRIPESALEEFLGVKLSSPVPEVISDSIAVKSTDSLTLVENDSALTNRDTRIPGYRDTKLPIKLARFLLIVALFTVLLDLVIAKSISLPAMIARIVFLLIMILLAYQEGGYRQG